MGTSTWAFGIRPLPFPIEGEPASVLLWTADDLIVHVDLEETALITDARIAAAFEQAVSAPASGVALGRPKRVIVESGALAKRVRPLFRGARIEIGSTSDVDHAFAAYLEDIAGARTEEEEAQDRRAFEETPEPWKPELLRIGRALAEAAPWELVPPDAPLECVIPSLGLDAGRLIVIGHVGESYGFLVFRSSAEYAAFDALARGGGPAANAVVPRFVGVDLVELELDGEPRDVATLTVVDGQSRTSPTENDRQLAIAVADALVAFVDQHEDALDDDAAWARGIVGQYRVEVLGTEVAVELTARGTLERDDADE